MAIRYTYDEVGNRLSRTRNGIAEPYTYAADSNRLLQSVDGGTSTYRYDANGNTPDHGDHDRLTAVIEAGHRSPPTPTTAEASGCERS